MSAHTSLKNQFLIAMPAMHDPNFMHSVTYICEHSPEGAMGIVINLPLNINLGDVFQNLDILAENANAASTRVLAGGPLQQERGFVIHRKTDSSWESSLELSDDISITTSKDILEAIAGNSGPKDAIIALGYAAWDAGQLEEEIMQNAWLCSPADLSILFNTPCENRWRDSAALLGVDMDMLSPDSGHS